MTTSEIDLSNLSDKESIRKHVWDHLECNDIARFPRPVHHRIPNFEGSEKACDRLLTLKVFQQANLVKINPDKAQQRARYLTLERGKTLLVPTPRLRTGLFNRIEPPDFSPEMLQICSTKEGITKYSTPIDLQDRSVKPDLIICGSVAVDMAGHRIGKGEGYADLEFGMLSTLGGYDRSRCTIISIVHDCQLFHQMDSSLFSEHDFLVDIILTPTQTIYCDHPEGFARKATPGILWNLLTEERLNAMPILRQLKSQQQQMKP